MENKDELLTQKEVCQQYKISEPTLRNVVRKGNLPQRRFYDGGKVLYRRSDIERILRTPKQKKTPHN